MGGSVLSYFVLHLLGLWATAIVLIIADVIMTIDIYDRRGRASWLSMLLLGVTIASIGADLIGKLGYLEIAAAAACVYAIVVLVDRNRVI